MAARGLLSPSFLNPDSFKSLSPDTFKYCLDNKVLHLIFIIFIGTQVADSIVVYQRYKPMHR